MIAEEVSLSAKKGCQCNPIRRKSTTYRKERRQRLDLLLPAWKLCIELLHAGG
jgi:hypothetical protein